MLKITLLEHLFGVDSYLKKWHTTLLLFTKTYSIQSSTILCRTSTIAIRKYMVFGAIQIDPTRIAKLDVPYLWLILSISKGAEVFA